MSYTSKFESKEMDKLFEAILSLETKEECYRFFEDLCTINEMHAMALRFHVARLLSMKKTYSDIEDETMASTATISRINKCLVYGSEGYRMVLDRLSEEEK
ncbi:MAG: YerC/YecD family TrpR-related protein [Bacillota bacterium]|nr:YerC/YecD family TrpR-related protein [Bacillota bacterium]